MQAKYNESGVLYVPSVLRRALTTERTETPRADLVCVRGADGSEWTIAATSERDEFVVEQGGGIARRYTRVQVELLLTLAAGASLVDCLAADLDPGDRVMEILADAWRKVIGRPLAVEPRTLPVLVIGRIGNVDAAVGSVLTLDLTPNMARLVAQLMRDRTALSPTQTRLLPQLIRALAADDEQEEDSTDSRGGERSRDDLHRLLDDHAERKAVEVIEDIVLGGLIERRYPGADPSQVMPYIGQEYQDAWRAVWAAADAARVDEGHDPEPGAILGRHRRATLVALYFGVAAQAPVPVGWLTPEFKHLVTVRIVPVAGGSHRVAVQWVKVKGVVEPWSRRGVPLRLRRQAGAIGKAHPGSPMVQATVSDTRRGRGGRRVLLAHSELALALPTVDGSVADKLELAVERVPRDLPLVPSASSEQDDERDRGEEQPMERPGPHPEERSWQVRIPTTPAPTPILQDQEQIGEFLLVPFDDGTLSVVHPPTGNRVDGLLVTHEERGWVRTVLAEATEEQLPRLSPALHLIVRAGAHPAEKQRGFSHLFRAVGLRPPWDEGGSR